MKVKSVFLFVFVFLLSFSVGVAAAPVDPDASGSVKVNVIYEETPVGGGSLTLFRVGDILWNNEEYMIALTKDFENADLPVTDIHKQSTAKQYADYAQANRIEGVTKPIDENGVVVFSELPVGLYLLARHECPLGYAAIAPFLVTVPLEVGGETVYDVDASPKVSFVYDISQGDRPENPDEPGDNPDGDLDEPDTPNDSDDPDTPDGSEGLDAPDGPDKIPQTGQLKWPIPILATAGVFLVFIGWWLFTDNEKVSR